MTSSFDPDRDLASQLRQTAGREWVEEAAEDERLTEVMRQRGLTISQLFADMVHRGERVSVDFGGHNFSGALVSGGEDYATIEGSGQVADVKLVTGIWSLLIRGQPVETRSGSPETFKALMQQYVASKTRLRVALPDNQVAVGSIAVVAVDHIELLDADGRPIYIPDQSVLAVIRSSEIQ
jgi:hypothetical protein